MLRFHPILLMKNCLPESENRDFISHGIKITQIYILEKKKVFFLILCLPSKFGIIQQIPAAHQNCCSNGRATKINLLALCIKNNRF